MLKEYRCGVGSPPPHPACLWQSHNNQKKNAAWLDGHIPALDGLRGLAAIVVVVFHVQNTPLPGGFIGVGIFFVLSGYLITSLLLREYEGTGQISLLRFYLRRALRLMPALWALLLITLLVVYVWDHSIFAREARDAGASLLYASNWTRALRTQDMRYFTHTWSLAVEEQFYLLWPAVLYVCIRRGGTRLVLRTALIVAACSWLWRIVLLIVGARWRRVYGLDTCLEFPMWGCALAAWLHGKNAIALPRRCAVAALAAIIFAAVMPQSGETGFFYYFAYTAVTWLAAALILDAVHNPHSCVRRILCWPPLMQLGVVSYSVYLWHFVCCIFLERMQASGLAAQMGTIAWGTLLALLSFALIERPFLRLKARFSAG